jgi:hypothetical protein
MASSKERQERFRKAQAEKGFVLLRAYVPEAALISFEEAAEACRGNPELEVGTLRNPTRGTFHSIKKTLRQQAEEAQKRAAEAARIAKEAAEAAAAALAAAEAEEAMQAALPLDDDAPSFHARPSYSDDALLVRGM